MSSPNLRALKLPDYQLSLANKGLLARKAFSDDNKTIPYGPAAFNTLCMRENTLPSDHNHGIDRTIETQALLLGMINQGNWGFVANFGYSLYDWYQSGLRWNHVYDLVYHMSKVHPEQVGFGLSVCKRLIMYETNRNPEAIVRNSEDPVITTLGQKQTDALLATVKEIPWTNLWLKPDTGIGPCYFGSGGDDSQMLAMMMACHTIRTAGQKLTLCYSDYLISLPTEHGIVMCPVDHMGSTLVKTSHPIREGVGEAPEYSPLFCYEEDWSSLTEYQESE